jgi:type I restriction-modification system DNA methylase subunit
MALFQSSVIQKELQNLNQTVIDEKWNEFIAHFGNVEIQQKIRGLKEEQYQGEFLDDLFVKVLGYTKPPKSNHNLVTEQKNETNSKKADGAIIVDEKVIGVLELKGTNTTDLEKVKEQAFLYKVSHPECIYVITSNFEKLRFYIENTVDYIEFNLFQLTKKEFSLLYICLSYENIKNNVPKHLKDESVSKESKITKQLYKDYSDFKQALFNNLVELNPQYDKLLLFKKTQKLLDRFLFIFFAEDRQLVPTNLIRRINLEWEDIVKVKRLNVSLYDRYKTYFHDLNAGATVTLPAFGKKTGDAITAQFEIFAYNGGLFMPDEVLDNVKIDDALLHKHSILLSDYDFESDVDVNILGHIFENSLNEIDEIKSEIEGQVIDKTKTKRKKDGVFYTPKYITKYIVDNTVGKLCTEKKNELKLIEEEYHSEKNLQTKTKKALLDKLTEYRNWLLNITICDPACGSGAFLNQALEFLIAEHRYIDELQAKLMGDSMILSDVEASILENNLFGVDLNDESVEIAKLSLWLRTAQRGRKLTSLNNNIKCGNSLIDDPEVAGDKAFSWEKEFSTVFKNGGFDVVIGNPPYVRQELLGQKQKDFFSVKYKNVYNGIADLYVYFYDLSISLIKEKGLLGFITPNKWMERKYGFELRSYLINLDILQIVNFGELRIFEDASTEPEITILINSSSDITNIQYKMIKSLDEAKQTPYSLIHYDKLKLNSSIWRFNDDKSFNILEKFKTSNINLNEYTQRGVFRGVLTGLNEAFIINEESRNEIMNADVNASEILKKMVEGDDFSRWSLNHSGRYMITTFPSKKIDITRFPGVMDFLGSFGSKIEQSGEKGSRKKTINKWFETQDTISYSDLFKLPKLIYYHTASTHNFYFDTEGYYISANCYIIANADRYLQCVLNSKLFHYVKKFLFPAFGDSENGGRVRLDANKMSALPIKEVSNDLKLSFQGLAEEISVLSREFDNLKFKFRKYFSSKYAVDKVSGKLSNWFLLDFSEFIKELNKAIKAAKGTQLTKKDEFEWMELFEENKKKALELKSQIDQTDKEIDRMVYELYGLTEEEIQIISDATA